MSLVVAMKRRALRAALLAVLVAVGAVGLANPAAGQPVQVGPVTWRVTAGTATADQAIQANAFLPREIFINVGDTVTWTVGSGEFHTVTFLSGGPRPPLVIPAPDGGVQFNPVAVSPAGGPMYNGTGFVNSGLLFQGQTFSLTFTAPGDFTYVCLIHGLMTATVHVRPAGTPYPHDQAFYDAQGRAQGAAILGRGAGQTGQALAAALSRFPFDQVVAGVGDGETMGMRFLPQTLVVRQGQTVTWTNRDAEAPHTVTFGPEPSEDPLDAFAPAGTDAPGHATITAPGQAVNSGFIGVGLPFGTQFRVTFAAPGTYRYICALHDELGMVGTVVVVP
ncbi:MAG TPA: plastocyanin/azurin family copper-binding protein [Dehalococcoidia bacterium]